MASDQVCNHLNVTQIECLVSFTVLSSDHDLVDTMRLRWNNAKHANRSRKSWYRISSLDFRRRWRKPFEASLDGDSFNQHFLTWCTVVRHSCTIDDTIIGTNWALPKLNYCTRYIGWYWMPPKNVPMPNTKKVLFVHLITICFHCQRLKYLSTCSHHWRPTWSTLTFSPGKYSIQSLTIVVITYF